MVYYNLKLVIEVKKNIHHMNSYEELSRFIFNAMQYDEQMRKLQKSRKYKLYSFCNLYNPELDGVYKKGNVYFFDIKFLDLKFAISMKHFLSLVENKYFKVIMSSIKTSQYKKISKLISLTPAIFTNNSRRLFNSRRLRNYKKKNYYFNTKEILPTLWK